MKNTMMDLNNHLFEQIERLMDDDLDIDTEIKRSKALEGLADKAIANAKLSLEAEQFVQDYGYRQKAELPAMLESKDD